MKHFLLLLCVVFAFQASAQKPEWGRMLEAERKSYTPNIVGDDDDAIYTVDMINNKTLLFEKYDKRRLNRKYSRQVSVPEKNNRRYDLEKISFIGDNFLVFGSYYDRKAKEYELRAFPYSADRVRNDGSEEIFKSEVERRWRKGDFSVFPSKNKERFLVHFSAYYKETDQTIDRIKLFNKELELLVEKEYILDGRSEGAISNVIVDDEGSVYFIRNQAVVILDANADFEEWSEPIVVEEMERNGSLDMLYFTLNSDNDLVVVGNYITTDLHKTDENKRRKDRKKDDEQVEGVYFMRINGFSKETEVARLNKFDQDFLDQFKSAKDVRKGRSAEMNDNYNSFDFFFKEDGGVIFVAEEQYSVQYYRNGSLVGENYFYNDLVTYNFSADGDLIWANRVPKSQQFYWRSFYLGFNYGSYGWSWLLVPHYQQGHFSYMAGLSDDKFYLIFNDDKKNVNLTNDSDRLRPMKNIRKAVPVVYSIDLETGHKDKKMDLSYATTEARLRPNVSYQSSQENPLYIFGIRKKGYRFGKIEFQEKPRARASR